MIINLNNYKSVIPSIQSIIKVNTHLSVDKLTGICSVSTGAPIICCAYYIGSIIGMSPGLLLHIDNLKKFYKIEDVLFVEEFIK